MIRGLGIEARLVASLQPIGFGWAKHEEALDKRRNAPQIPKMDDADEVFAPSDESDSTKTLSATKSTKKPSKNVGGKHTPRGARSAPIDLSEDSATDGEEDIRSEDDASVVDITPSTPRKRANMKYDRDMPFPTYWAEVISPITSEVIPVDPIILTAAVATNPENLAQFESRGAKADKAKQVFGYIVAYSTDGTAKDVTTRYLKRHMWPGRTKSVFTQPIIPLFKLNGSSETLFRDSRAPSESMVLTWRNTTEGYEFRSRKCPSTIREERSSTTKIMIGSRQS